MTPIGRHGVRFGIAGTPVTISWSFPAIMVAVGLLVGQSALEILLWTLMVLISVLWHEAGHAAALTAYDRRSQIVIHGFVGLTIADDPRPMRDPQLIVVSLAGPFAGAALGIILMAVLRQWPPVDGSIADFVLTRMVWINLGWGLVNLLPVLPLDGGHVLQQAVNMVSPSAADVVPHWVAIAVAAPLGGLALGAGEPFLALFAGLFVVLAVRSLVEVGRERRWRRAHQQVTAALSRLHGSDPTAAIAALESIDTSRLPDELADPVHAGLAWARLWRNGPGDLDAVDALAERVSPRQETALLRGAVAWQRGRRDQAMALLSYGFGRERREPPAWFGARLGLDAVALDELGRWLDQLELFDRHDGLARLAATLDRAGRSAEARTVRERMARPVAPVVPG